MSRHRRRQRRIATWIWLHAMLVSRGDVVLVRLIFADEQGHKRRPALVLSSGAYHDGRQEVIVAAVTSNMSRSLPGDHALKNWREAGLPMPSLVTSILRTIKRGMVEHVLGHIRPRDLRAVEGRLREILVL